VSGSIITKVKDIVLGHLPLFSLCPLLLCRLGELSSSSQGHKEKQVISAIDGKGRAKDSVGEPQMKGRKAGFSSFIPFFIQVCIYMREWNFSFLETHNDNIPLPLQ
jgi:hypothetical protein